MARASSSTCRRRARIAALSPRHALRNLRVWRQDPQCAQVRRHLQLVLASPRTATATPSRFPIAQHPEWYSTFTDPVYYDGTYGGKYPAVTDWGKLRGWVAGQRRASLSSAAVPASTPTTYDLIERIPAGYVMNTIELASRVRLVAGLRFEATHVSTLSFDSGATPLPPRSPSRPAETTSTFCPAPRCALPWTRTPTFASSTDVVSPAPIPRTFPRPSASPLSTRPRSPSASEIPT